MASVPVFVRFPSRLRPPPLVPDADVIVPALVTGPPTVTPLAQSPLLVSVRAPWAPTSSPPVLPSEAVPEQLLSTASVWVPELPPIVSDATLALAALSVTV